MLLTEYITKYNGRPLLTMLKNKIKYGRRLQSHLLKNLVEGI